LLLSTFIRFPLLPCIISLFIDHAICVNKPFTGDRLGKIQIFAGDIVPNKKPAPDVYLLAAKELGVEPSRCWVIEDSEIGCKAAKSAGMKCVVTKSIYTQNESFEGAEV
jgi:beta-phosphoglucomutase-like phosphatase (HAD superfamily)